MRPPGQSARRGPGPARSRKAAKRASKKAKRLNRRPAAKKDVLLGLISRKNGASLEELTLALKWQKHSVRGFIATLGKTVSIESFKTEQGVRTYKAS